MKMDIFGEKLNELLVGVYRQIEKIEEESLRAVGPSNLSISELHLLEAAGKDRENGRTISDIAQDQDITLPSVTAAVNKLAKKGYVEKVKAEHDGRVVYVRLTRLGRKVDSGHRRFHQSMVRSLSKDLSEQDRRILVDAMDHLNQFLHHKIEEIEETNARKIAAAEASHEE